MLIYSNMSEVVVITADNICSLCVYMSFEDIENKVFVAILANLLEKDWRIIIGAHSKCRCINYYSNIILEKCVLNAAYMLTY